MTWKLAAALAGAEETKEGISVDAMAMLREHAAPLLITPMQQLLDAESPAKPGVKAGKGDKSSASDSREGLKADLDALVAWHREFLGEAKQKLGDALVDDFPKARIGLWTKPQPLSPCVVGQAKGPTLTHDENPCRRPVPDDGQQSDPDDDVSEQTPQPPECGWVRKQWAAVSSWDPTQTQSDPSSDPESLPSDAKKPRVPAPPKVRVPRPAPKGVGMGLLLMAALFVPVLDLMYSGYIASLLHERAVSSRSSGLAFFAALVDWQMVGWIWSIFLWHLFFLGLLARFGSWGKKGTGITWGALRALAKLEASSLRFNGPHLAKQHIEARSAEDAKTEET